MECLLPCHCNSGYVIRPGPILLSHVIFDYVHPLMELIRFNSRTALFKGENDHVLWSYTVTSLHSVRAIDYYINKNWPRTLAHAKQHCTAVHPLCSHARQTSPRRGIRERLRLTITWNFICCYNSNKRGHAILLKSQYYSTPAATRFRPHWSIIREHKVVPTFV